MGQGKLKSNRVHFEEIEDYLARLISQYSGKAAKGGPKPEQPFFFLKNDNGVCHFHVSWTMWKNDFRMKITGTDGAAVISGLGSSYGVETLRVYKRGGEGKIFLEESYTGEDLSFVDELKDFLECISNKKQPDTSLVGALESISIVEKIYSKGVK